MSEAKKIPQDLLDECETLALQLAPELGASPLYFVNVPLGHPRQETCAAFTSRGAINFSIRHELIAAGRYRGPGPMIAFCDNTMWRTATLAVALHEVSHNLPYQQPQADFEPSEALRNLQRICIENQIADDSKRLIRPWNGDHDLGFIRRCLHLHWRAWQIGYEIGAGDMYFAGNYYGLSPHWMYLHAIGIEPQRMANESFEAIEAEPYPTEFIELWRNDVGRWYRTHPEALTTQGEVV